MYYDKEDINTKRRIIALLLCLAICTSLLTGFTVSAAATFDPEGALPGMAYLTFVLRALGYDDALTKSKDVALISGNTCTGTKEEYIANITAWLNS